MQINIIIGVLCTCLEIARAQKRTFIQPRERPRRQNPVVKSPWVPPIRGGGPIMLPSMTKEDAAQLRIPSGAFCTHMELGAADRYFLLPWWYYYCLSLIEKKNKKFQHGVYNLPLYKRVLDKIQQYKKRQSLIDAMRENFIISRD